MRHMTDKMKRKGFEQGNKRLIQTQGLDNKKARRLDKNNSNKTRIIPETSQQNSTYNNNPNLKS